MRFFVISLTVVSALATTISAMPTDASIESIDTCKTWCIRDRQCNTCGRHVCVSFSGLRPGFNHMTNRDGRSWCAVSHVFDFTSVQHGSWN
ncbi:hypothetical protein BDR07DRAFT_1388103 [Suillus spraguei]|nr:hypothetical protein BDR07DRAFT_1388103 [Suillus spraguei]